MGPQQMFMSKFLQQQGDDPKMMAEMLQEMMGKNGTLMQRSMSKYPKVYQALLRAQTALHSAQQEMKQSSEQHAPIQNAVAELTRMMPNQKPPQY